MHLIEHDLAKHQDQVSGLIAPDDVVVMISGSGQSPNIVQAARTARSDGAVTVGLTGGAGGPRKDFVDICLIVPSIRMEQIEDVHLALEHALCGALRQMVGRTLVLRRRDESWPRTEAPPAGSTQANGGA